MKQIDIEFKEYSRSRKCTMRNLLSNYILTTISLLRHKIYNVVDVLRNLNSIWEIDEIETIKQKTIV